VNPKAVCLVGHEDWGKSETLYHLVGGSRHKGWITINNLNVFVRHMSNDDIPDSFIDFINNISTEIKPYIVVALCPNFKDPEAKTDYILKTIIKKGYGLHFWVLRYKYGSNYGITAEEINELKKHGEVTVYSEKTEAEVRTTAFREYLYRTFHA